MKENELIQWIDGLTQDIIFYYRGIEGSICPFTRTNISVSYGDTETTVRSPEDVLGVSISGKPFRNILSEVEFE